MHGYGIASFRRRWRLDIGGIDRRPLRWRPSYPRRPPGSGLLDCGPIFPDGRRRCDTFASCPGVSGATLPTIALRRERDFTLSLAPFAGSSKPSAVWRRLPRQDSMRLRPKNPRAQKGPAPGACATHLAPASGLRRGASRPITCARLV